MTWGWVNYAKVNFWVSSSFNTIGFWIKEQFKELHCKKKNLSLKLRQPASTDFSTELKNQLKLVALKSFFFFFYSVAKTKSKACCLPVQERLLKTRPMKSSPWTRGQTIASSWHLLHNDWKNSSQVCLIVCTMWLLDKNVLCSSHSSLSLTLACV